MRIYLDTYVWCRSFDEPSPRVKREAEAFFEILRGVDEREIKRLTGIKDEDAFHSVAAIEGKAECFITVDDHILAKANKIKRYGIKVLNPINLVEV